MQIGVRGCCEEEESVDGRQLEHVPEFKYLDWKGDNGMEGEGKI